MKRATLVAIAVAGCTQDVDPAWQLDHDRVIAVRVTPARLASGEVGEVDALVGRKAQPPSELDPDTAEVVSPTSLVGALGRPSTRWTVTAPADAQLVDARAELELEAGAPVPLRLRVTFAETGLVGLKIVWLGEHSDNPVLDPITIGGVDASTAPELTVAPAVDIPLAVNFDNSFAVNWLTSCGTMHDFDLAHAYLRVETEDPQSGTLAVVVRDALGGVAWRLWPIAAR